MTLFSHRVLVPYRLDDAISAPLYSMLIEAAASGHAAAQATATVLAEAAITITHARPGRLLLDRIRVGTAGTRISGPYAYVFGNGDRIPLLTMAARIDSTAGQDLIHALTGLRLPWVRGLVLDCAGMQVIAKDTLQALAREAPRLHLQLFRVPRGIGDSLRQLGLTRSLAIHPDLHGALAGLRHTLDSETIDLDA